MRPTVSVIVPMYNAGETIGHQLAALSEQTFAGPWELVISDNGSTDDARRVAEEWSDRIPHMRIIDASARRGAAFARNAAAETAHGEALAFCDADDVVSPSWLEAMVSALRDADFVTGSVDWISLEGRHPASPIRSLPLKLGFMPSARGGNMAVSRRAFDDVGGFDERFVVGQDVAISWRLQLAGHDLRFEPKALVTVRSRGDLRSLWRQQSAWGAVKPLLYKQFRQYGMPRSSVSAAIRVYLKLLIDVPKLFSRTSRGEWILRAAQRWGRFVGSLRQRILYL